MKVLFAGGGTGGHLYPAIAMAHHLRRAVPGAQCLFLGSRGGLESRIVPHEGFELVTIASSGFRRLDLRGRLLFLWSFLCGFASALRLVHRYRPDLVVATGGHASLAGGLAAAFWRRPLVVQEQNRIPGLATRLLARLAQRVYVGFPDTESRFPDPSRVRCLGNPVRDDLLQPRAAQAGAAVDCPVLLVLGGSRGARSINRAVASAIPLLRERAPVQWIWQTGSADFAALQPAWEQAPDVEVREYVPDVGAAYAAATLLLCRSGAMTLAEITALGKPAILVPFPGAVDDHQTANARYLTEAGAAVLVPDAELSGARLCDEIAALLLTPGRLGSMAAESQKLARPDATRHLVADFLALVNAGA